MRDGTATRSDNTFFSRLLFESSFWRRLYSRFFKDSSNIESDVVKKYTPYPQPTITPTRYVSVIPSPELLAFQQRISSLPAEIRHLIYDNILHEENQPLLSHGKWEFVRLCGIVNGAHSRIAVNSQIPRSVEYIYPSVPAPFKRDESDTDCNFPGARGYFPYVRIFKGVFSEPIFAGGQQSLVAQVLGRNCWWELLLRWIENREVVVEGVIRLPDPRSCTAGLAGAGDEIAAAMRETLRIAEDEGKDAAEKSLAFWLHRVRRLRLILHVRSELFTEFTTSYLVGNDMENPVDEILEKAKREMHAVVQSVMGACAVLFSRSEKLQTSAIELEFTHLGLKSTFGECRRDWHKSELDIEAVIGGLAPLLRIGRQRGSLRTNRQAVHAVRLQLAALR